VPEGPEIRRSADRIEAALAGRPVSRIQFAFPKLRRHAPVLTGSSVTAVETRGKAMLIHFDAGLSIYTHSQLYGRWFVRASGQYPRTNRSLRLAIHNEERSALLYSASEIDVLAADRVDEHPFLAKLGPDALDPGLSHRALVSRIGDRRFARRQLHALLLDQSFVAGIGNYLRSEILFVAGIHPTRRPGELEENERRELSKAIRNVTKQAYATGGITNDRKRAKRLKAEGLRRSQYRHHVFTRGGRPCWTCETKLRKQVLGGRQIYHCPTCQPAAETES